MGVYIRTGTPWPEPRTPWANTLAYYPLNSTTTVNDKSGNGYNLTNNGGVTFNSLWATFSSNKWLSWSNFAQMPTRNSNRTYSIWFKQSSSIGTANYVFSMGSFVSLELVALSIYNNSNNAYIDYWNGSIALGYVPTLNRWHNAVFTNDGNWQKLYIDGVLKWTSTKTLATTNSVILWMGDASQFYFNWGMSEFIVENKARTAQEVAYYYNQTKSTYWIS